MIATAAAPCRDLIHSAAISPAGDVLGHVLAYSSLLPVLIGFGIGESVAEHKTPQPRGGAWDVGCGMWEASCVHRGCLGLGFGPSYVGEGPPRAKGNAEMWQHPKLSSDTRRRDLFLRPAHQKL